MRRAVLWLTGPDRYTTRWEFVENGKTTFDETYELTRVGAGK
jgi:hypothetical protein